MNLQQISDNGIIDELAEVIQDDAQARIMLESIGYPRRGRPNFPNDGDTLEYWMNVCSQIEAGVLPSGTDLQPLINAAARRYPTNPIFSQYRTKPPSEQQQPDAQQESEQSEAQQQQTTQQAQPQQNERFVYILVQHFPNVEELIDSVRNLAHELGIPSDIVNLEFANAEGVILHMRNYTPEQALTFARQIDAQLRDNGNRPQSSVSTSQFSDYLLSRLFVEGPDQARFELNDVRASTRVGDIAQGVFGTQYEPGVFADGSKGGRQVVVDHLKEDGSTERLYPDKTLDESKVQDGDTLHVAPESTAGAINPVLREEALARVRSQVAAYAKSHPGFEVQANSKDKPTEYVFRFQAPSWGTPLNPEEEPGEINEHEVFLYLPADFPMEAPEAFWQKDIFHPNVHPDNGKVCLGVLEDHYKPGLDFASLCQMLVDIASYQNYAVSEGYNEEAMNWAISEKGQIAIEQRGGKSVIRQLFDQVRTPVPLRIKRVKE